MKKKINGKIVLYQAKTGAIELRGDVSRQTIWATQAQMADIFYIDRTVVTRHISNILKDKEIDQKSNVQKIHIANSDKPVAFYSLDIVLAVGYRAHSSKAIEFRQWATKTLRGYIVDGYAINRSRITKNYERFLGVVEDIKKLLPAGDTVGPTEAIDLVALFAETWLSLDAYDKGLFPKGKLTKRRVLLTAQGVIGSLGDFKRALLKSGEVGEIFGTERIYGAVAGIIGNIMQTFSGKELYPTVEEKAAHLLYFMVKNHPFIDGNKRSGAYAFVWFLNHAGALNRSRINPLSLTALTLFVAESDPKNKEKIIGLILNLLK